jgi:unsaturated chondroitin disaccharide hydrolase
MNTPVASHSKNLPSAQIDPAHETRQRAFDVCVRKARASIKLLADSPRSAAWAEDGNFFAFKEEFFEIGNWTSSFFTGMALLAWQETEDEYFLTQTLRLEPHYHEKVFVRYLDTHHDIGFLYSLYSVALYKLTGDPRHKATGLQAAAVLAQRFNEKGNFIRAWGHMNTTEHDNMAIIDCLMNLPLLYWATEGTNNAKYRRIAECHADTVLKNFIRPDNSLCHAFRFDLKTGKPLGVDNFCGRDTESYWARGAAWAIYGFALSYRYTRHQRYLDASLRLAEKFISELDQEVVPVWDFRLPAKAAPIRDSSAAAIAVCGFQELAEHGVANPQILKAKNALLDSLCSPKYLDDDANCPGVLKSAYGDKVAYSSWGDYFFMEALARELSGFKPWW